MALAYQPCGLVLRMCSLLGGLFCSAICYQSYRLGPRLSPLSGGPCCSAITYQPYRLGCRMIPLYRGPFCSAITYQPYRLVLRMSLYQEDHFVALLLTSHVDLIPVCLHIQLILLRLTALFLLRFKEYANAIS